MTVEFENKEFIRNPLVSPTVKNGQGTFTSPDGSNYVEVFKDGKKNGQGTYTFPDGRVWSGPWKDGEFLGRK